VPGPGNTTDLNSLPCGDGFCQNHCEKPLTETRIKQITADSLFITSEIWVPVIKTKSYKGITFSVYRNNLLSPAIKKGDPDGPPGNIGINSIPGYRVRVISVMLPGVSLAIALTIMPVVSVAEKVQL